MFSGREDESKVISPLAHKPMFASYAPFRSEGLHVIMSETPSSICPTIETRENFQKKPFFRYHPNPNINTMSYKHALLLSIMDQRRFAHIRVRFRGLKRPYALKPNAGPLSFDTTVCTTTPIQHIYPHRSLYCFQQYEIDLVNPPQYELRQLCICAAREARRPIKQQDVHKTQTQAVCSGLSDLKAAN